MMLAEQPARTAPPGGTAGEILVVDDDPGILYLLEKLLNQMRLSVVTAADAETALSLFEKGMHPALVITDQKLPGIQGIAFARLVRKRFPRMPIILCSSCSSSFNPLFNRKSFSRSCIVVLQQLFGHA